MKKHSTEGKHVLADFYGCKFKGLNSVKELTKLIVSAMIHIEATIKSVDSYKFKPQGITITVILSESSLVVHTYPEHKYVSIDIYTCGTKAKPEIGMLYFKMKLRAKKQCISMVNRGNK